MATLPPEVLARARAQECLEAHRREINRAMIAAARERDEYVARGSALRSTPEAEAHARLRHLLRDHLSPELAALREQALAWLAADRQEQPEPARRRTARQPSRAPRRPRRHPLEYVQGCPFRVTLTQARLLDLRVLGAQGAEIAAIETIAPGTVYTALKRLSGALGASGTREGLAHWRAWCAASGRTPDPALVSALDLLRGRPVAAGEQQDMPHAG